MVGLSTAKVMQLAAMKVKMIKSNQSLDVKSLQNCLVLKSEYFMHLTCQNYRITMNCRNHGMDSYYLFEVEMYLQKGCIMVSGVESS